MGHAGRAVGAAGRVVGVHVLRKAAAVKGAARATPMGMRRERRAAGMAGAGADAAAAAVAAGVAAAAAARGVAGMWALRLLLARQSDDDRECQVGPGARRLVLCDGAGSPLIPIVGPLQGGACGWDARLGVCCAVDCRHGVRNHCACMFERMIVRAKQNKQECTACSLA